MIFRKHWWKKRAVLSDMQENLGEASGT